MTDKKIIIEKIDEQSGISFNGRPHKIVEADIWRALESPALQEAIAAQIYFIETGKVKS